MEIRSLGLMLEFDVHSKQKSLGLFALIFKFDALFVETYIQKKKRNQDQ